jgi:peptide/nickel transport system substrate-binding protein
MKNGTRRGAKLLATLGVVGALGLSACTSSSSSSTSAQAAAPGSTALTSSTVIPVDEGTPKNGGTLLFGVDAEPASLNPVSGNFSMQNELVANSMLEPLMMFDKDQKAQPYLAESMTPENLASKWIIKIKPNITFHDGSKLDATAVKANLEAQKAGIASIANKVVSGFVVVDPLTVEVDMTQPWASYPSELAAQQGLMISPASISAPDSGTHPVGTGPFQFERWDRGNKLVVKKYANYWQAGKPHLDGIEFRFLPDPASRSEALQSADINMMWTDSTQAITQYAGKAGYKAIVDSSGDAQSIVLNEATAPFNNINARKAVIYATDNKAITEAMGNGLLQPIDQPFSIRNPYHQDDPHYPAYNLDAATKAAQQYKTETGQDLSFTLTTVQGSDNVTLAQTLQAQWAKAGITAQISAIDQSTMISQVVFGKTQALLQPNFGYPDPDFYYFFWHGSFTAPIGQLSVNFPHIDNPDLNKALDDGRINLVPSIRKEAYNKGVQILNDNFTYVWIYRYVSALVAADNVHGLAQAEQVGFSNTSAKGWYADLWLGS